MERRDLRGLPVFFEPGPEPAVASLIFRTGICDEVATHRGITHLVEHLTLFAVGTREHPCNGFVDLLDCIFYAHGTQQEIEDFLSRVVTALSDLPLDRLETEKRILERESAADDGDIVSQLMAARFGTRGFGAANVRELGLRWLGPEPIEDWARERFSMGNAALWIHAPEPPANELALPPGPRVPPPPAEPLSGLEFPAWVGEGTGGVAIGAIARREWASTLWLAVARERVFERLRLDEGLVYDVWADYAPLGSELSHVSLGAGCPDQDAGRVADAIMTTLEELRDSGPSDEELAALKRRIERAHVEDPDAARQELNRAATDALVGREFTDPEDELLLLRSVEADEVRAIAEAGLTSLLLRLPAETPSPREDLAQLERPPAQIDAPRFKVKALRQGGTEVAIGDAGISYTRDGEVVAIPADEVAAVLEGGVGELTIIAVDGSWVEVKPESLRDSEAATEAIRRLSTAPPIPSDDNRSGSVEQLASEKLNRRWIVQGELAVLPDVLQLDEQPLTLAEASRGMRAGLLVVTDRRLLFLFTGLRKEEFLQFSRSDVREVRPKRRLFENVLLVAVGDDELEFSDVKPRERVREIVAEFDGAR